MQQRRVDLRFIPGDAPQRLGQGGTDRASQQQRKQQLGISLQGEHKQGTEQRRAIGSGKQGGGADGRQLGLGQGLLEVILRSSLPSRALATPAARATP